MREFVPQQRLRAVSAQRDGAAPLIGSSAVMRGVRDRIERVALTDFTVLIEGESGTGKELVARQIHDISPRRRPVRGAQLRGACRVAAGGRAVRHRGPHGHGRAGAQRQVRARRRRHAVSRRSGRSVAVGAGQAAARDSGSVGGARGRPGHPSRRHATGGRHQQEPQRPGRRRDCFGPISTTGSPASTCTCRRCAIGAKTSSSWRPIFSSGIVRRGISSCRERRRPTRCSPTTGRATCASSSG